MRHLLSNRHHVTTSGLTQAPGGLCCSTNGVKKPATGAKSQSNRCHVSSFTLNASPSLQHSMLQLSIRNHPPPASLSWRLPQCPGCRPMMSFNMPQLVLG